MSAHTRGGGPCPGCEEASAAAEDAVAVAALVRQERIDAAARAALTGLCVLCPGVQPLSRSEAVREAYAYGEEMEAERARRIK